MPLNDFFNKEEPYEEPLSGPSRKIQAIEVLVFLFLIVPSLTASFLIGRGQTSLGFITVAISSIISDLSLLSLVLYFIWRNGEKIFNLGIRRDNLAGEIGVGLLLFLPVVLAANYLQKALNTIGLSAPSKAPSFLSATGYGGIVLAVVLVIVVAVVEEVVFRGYLILRLYNSTRNTVFAVLFSSVIFSIGHGYQGMAGVVSIFFLGIVLAVIYIWRASLIAPMIIHFLIDFSSIVIPSVMKKIGG